MNNDALGDIGAAFIEVEASSHKTIQGNLKSYLSTIDTSPSLSAVTARLPPVDFDAWYTSAKATEGSMAGSASLSWPVDRDEAAALQLAIIRHIAFGNEEFWQFTHHFFHCRDSRLDSYATEFVTHIVAPFNRAFVRMIKKSLDTTPLLDNGMEVSRASEQEISVFISHSSKDASIAALIAKLCKDALNLRSEQIRCTSVAGYKLPAGTKASSQLRRESVESFVMIAVISADSIQSVFSVFEMGARWGAERPLIPIAVPGFKLNELPKPLDELSALSCGNESDLLQLVRNIAEKLGVLSEPTETYLKSIQEIAGLSSQVVSEPSTMHGDHARLREISFPEMAILAALGHRDQGNGTSVTIAELAKQTSMDPILVRHHLDAMAEIGFVNVNTISRTTYAHMLQDGRAYLINRAAAKR